MNLRKYLKSVAALFLIPLVQWRLRKERSYTYRGITVTILPGVFHPGFFYSTKFLLSYLAELELLNKSLLELGCGSGLISIVSAKAGARVTSTDLSNIAVRNTRQNAMLNGVVLKTINSDLFDDIKDVFDLIVVNPPYYAKDPTNEPMLAWHCGKNFEYFQKFFNQLSNHIHPRSEIIMVLTKGSDLSAIFEIAAKSGFSFELIREKNVLFDEKDYLYKIKSNSFA